MDKSKNPSRRWWHGLLLAALMCTLFGLSIEQTAAQDEIVCAETITVQSGDTLSTIAFRALGSPGNYQPIVDATNAKADQDPLYREVADINFLSVGQRLCVPARSDGTPQAVATQTPESTPTREDIEPTEHPLSVTNLRSQEYPGSDITIVERLAPGSNYVRRVISYESEDLTVYALLTVPQGQTPATGWPVIIFNHGYITPELYRTAARYVAYVDYFARNGYIVVMPDYRGHGFSEGEPTSGHSTPGYTIDVLNAMASIQKYPAADPDRIGFWGHSMGGGITLRAMVLSSEIDAGVIWGGVVASYPDLLYRDELQGVQVPHWFERWRDEFLAKYGTPEENPELWTEISPNFFLEELSGPIQLHHGSADTSVPVQYSRVLDDQIQDVEGMVEFYEYPGDNHNISGYFNTAMRHSLAFFDRYVKNVEQ